MYGANYLRRSSQGRQSVEGVIDIGTDMPLSMVLVTLLISNFAGRSSAVRASRSASTCRRA
jgi:hypothetical protein